jgi:hypothetical protein
MTGSLMCDMPRAANLDWKITIVANPSAIGTISPAAAIPSIHDIQRMVMARQPLKAAAPEVGQRSLTAKMMPAMTMRAAMTVSVILIAL